MASRRRQQRRPTAAATTRQVTDDAAPEPVAVPGRGEWIGDVLCVVLIGFWLAQFLGLLIRVLVRG